MSAMAATKVSVSGGIFIPLFTVQVGILIDPSARIRGSAVMTLRVQSIYRHQVRNFRCYAARPSKPSVESVASPGPPKRTPQKPGLRFSDPTFAKAEVAKAEVAKVEGLSQKRRSCDFWLWKDDYIDPRSKFVILKLLGRIAELEHSVESSRKVETSDKEINKPTKLTKYVESKIYMNKIECMFSISKSIVSERKRRFKEIAMISSCTKDLHYCVEL
ncbi:hypothetical protein MTR67_007664, partial [Solanum verrucosum]